MEILLGAIISIVTQATKPWVEKYGKAYVLILVFGLAFAGNVVFEITSLRDTEFWGDLLRTVSYSIATYELILKNIPSLKK